MCRFWPLIKCTPGQNYGKRTILTARPLYATPAISAGKAQHRLLVNAIDSFMLLGMCKGADINDNTSLVYLVLLYLGSFLCNRKSSLWT